ncbi:MAG: Ni/Fe hydrogenase subunit alpha [Oligoflexales bacterium]|nr:Ni/Fe hydrogenase subunit alpha [Oligoflexales bacterium]
MNTRTIDVKYLARVEGEGALKIKIKDNTITELALKIFEPPRFFEAFLQGRNWSEAVDITSRICGICPVAYQISAAVALENAFAVNLPEHIHQLRRLIYYGEWIESHVLHIYMLHAPDFLRYPDAISMAKDHPELVKQGLNLKKSGNSIVNLLGGREIHPINIKVGGFYKLPNRAKVTTLLNELEEALDIARQTLIWASGLSFPNFESQYIYLSLAKSEEYPIYRGSLKSSNGLNFPVSDFESYIKESHVEHSNALHASLRNSGPYMTGPMARFNMNYQYLNPTVKDLLNQLACLEPCHNPFKSIVLRAAEVYHAVLESISILKKFPFDAIPSVEVQAKKAVGYGCSEAPRGVLYHKYEINEDGRIKIANIVPPTSQNQARIEQDLKEYVQKFIHLEDKELTYQCEQAIRNYDPCISCATHFLSLEVERS